MVALLAVGGAFYAGEVVGEVEGDWTAVVAGGVCEDEDWGEEVALRAEAARGVQGVVGAEGVVPLAGVVFCWVFA
jgi:hypothetical protein